MWVAVGNGNTIATSTDGINWAGRGTTIFTSQGRAIGVYTTTVAISTSVSLSLSSTVANRLDLSGALSVTGSISKSSGTFDIIHPLNHEKRLVHSFVEGPRCDLIYRGTTTLENGTITVNIDKECVSAPECAMEEGTFVVLCAHPVCMLQNKTSFSAVIGDISGNILTIRSNDENSADVIDWMVIAERKDPFIKNWDKTNHDGFLITEY
jgi:hypothetical protein